MKPTHAILHPVDQMLFVKKDIQLHLALVNKGILEIRI